MKRKAAFKWASIGLLTLISAFLAMRKFMFDYMTTETVNADGTAQGAMKTPEIMDMILFLSIILFGLLGLIGFLFNVFRLFKK